MKSIFILPHLGLGDALVCNGLVREYAENYDRVIFPSKSHNYQSVAWMFSDLPKVAVVPVKDDKDARNAGDTFQRCGVEVLKLGLFSSEPFDIDQWDKEMYRQAGISFSKRWDKFHAPPCPCNGIPSEPFAFIHDDKARGFAIEPEWNTSLRWVRAAMAGTMFAHRDAIEQATEIHCIDSCFAILADSVPTRATRLVLHLYARPGAKPPTYRKDWQILKECIR